MKEKYPKWIDEYGKAIYDSMHHHDVSAHMPFNGWDFYPLFADLIIEKIYSAVKNFKEKGLNVNEITDRLPNHNSMKFKLVEIIMWLKLTTAEPAKAKAIVDFFIDGIEARKVGAPLFLNNKIHTYENADQIIEKKKLVNATRELASEIGKITTGCATLVHGLYNDFCTDLSYDVYGPYSAENTYGKGTLLLVRSFSDLNPTELWPEHTPFPYKKIEIFSTYKNVEMTPTYVSCQMIYSGSLVDNLTHFQVEVEGKKINSLLELRAVREKLLQTASDLYVEYMNLGFEKQKELWLFQLCYQFKNLFDLVGQDWKPSQEMIDRVKGKELIPNVTSYEITKEEFYEKLGVTYLKGIYTK